MEIFTTICMPCVSLLYIDPCFQSVWHWLCIKSNFSSSSSVSLRANFWQSSWKICFCLFSCLFSFRVCVYAREHKQLQIQFAFPLKSSSHWVQYPLIGIVSDNNLLEHYFISEKNKQEHRAMTLKRTCKIWVNSTKEENTFQAAACIIMPRVDCILFAKSLI